MPCSPRWQRPLLCWRPAGHTVTGAAFCGLAASCRPVPWRL